MEIKFLRPAKAESPLVSTRNNDRSGKSYNVAIIGPIGTPDKYLNLANLLLNASENDDVVIRLASNGGYVCSGEYILAAMARCKARIRTHIESHAYSIAAVIWAYGDERTMGRLSRGMFHATSHGDIGRTTDIKERADVITKGFVELLTDIKERGIMSQEMYDDVVNKKRDVYFTKAMMSKLDNALTSGRE